MTTARGPAITHRSRDDSARRTHRLSVNSSLRLGSSTSSDASSARFLPPRISCRRKAPTPTKNAAAIKKGGVSAARSDSTALASCLVLAPDRWQRRRPAAPPGGPTGLIPGQSTSADLAHSGGTRARYYGVVASVPPAKTAGRAPAGGYLPVLRGRANVGGRCRMPGLAPRRAAGRLNPKTHRPALELSVRTAPMRIRLFIPGVSAPRPCGTARRPGETAFRLRQVARSRQALHQILQVSMREVKSAEWHLRGLSRDCEFRYAPDRNAVPNANP